MAYGRVNVGGFNISYYDFPQIDENITRAKYIWDYTKNYISLGSEFSNFIFSGFGDMYLEIETDMENNGMYISSTDYGSTSVRYNKIKSLSVHTLKNNRIKVETISQTIYSEKVESTAYKSIVLNGKIKNLKLKVIPKSGGYSCNVKTGIGNTLTVIF